MSKRSLSVLWIMIIATVVCVAQPGRPGGFPGGRPSGPPPGGERPGGWNRGDMSGDPRAQQVKQKKVVKSGTTFKVTGQLRDSVSGESLMFVNAAVLNFEDSSFVKGGSSDERGYFEIDGVPAGKYFLRVSSIGYQSLWKVFEVTNNTALGTIKLSKGSQQLRTVVVTAEKPLYAMDGEKMVYNVSEDPSIQTGTTEDALQNAPGVEVDVEGNITLRGVSSVEIWINDKPSKLTEENLKTYLQTLPANALARIETITNPSAKYATDAEAVINIVTEAHIKSNQFVSFGVNGSNQPFVGPWVSYMWAKERLSFNLFAAGRYTYRNNATNSWSIQRKDGSTQGEYDTTLHQTDSSTSKNRSLGGNFFMSVNYEIDSSSEISANMGGFANRGYSLSERNVEQIYYPLDIDSILAYGIGDSTRSRSMFTHAGLDYTKKFDNEGHNLRLGLNARNSHNYSNEWYDRLYTRYTDLDENRYLLTDNKNYGISFDARYNRPYSKDGEMSYGLRADHGQTNNSYQRSYSTDGGKSYDSVDALRQYNFRGAETSVNADVNWTHRWGGFTLSSGLGYGLGRTYYSYSETPFVDDSTFFTHSLRPSIHLSYRTQSMHNLKLNYSMRMSHPGEMDVTKMRIYGEDSYRTGNRDGLKPCYTHNVEAGWQKFFERFGNIGIEGYGRLSTNEISSLTDAEYDDYLERIVSYSIPYNMGTSWRYGSSINMTYRPTGFFNVRMYANVYDYGYRMEYMRGGVQKTDQNDMVSWSIRVNAWAKIFDQYQFTMSANYNSKSLGLMSVRGERYSLNMGVRSDFFKRKLSVFLNVQDIFNWGGRYGSTSGNTNPYFLSSSNSRNLNSRYIAAGITLRFGKMELERQARTDGTDYSTTTE
ncbi:MAG: outer membrane beta-barrel protein [Bacteroidales bacterium]|nr:outer membrane beta-barrel protein [Bacteroidales bacterium]